MKTLLSLLIALVMVISMSHGAVVTEDNSIAIVSKKSTPTQEKMFLYETVALEPIPGDKNLVIVPAPVTDPPTEEADDQEDETAASPSEPESVCEPPVRETEPEEGTIDREGEGVTAPPPCEPAPIAEDESLPSDETIALEGEGVTAPPTYETESVCNPPVEETQPEEGTIDLEGEGVACPPPCEPAPISDEEPEVPEETIALEPDPIVGPPIEEPAEP